MFPDRFVKCFSALHAGGDVAHDVTQTALALGIALVVKRGQSLDQRNASLNHGGELAREKHEVGFFNRPSFFTAAAGDSFLLERQHH